MKKALLYLILMTIMISCNGQSLDLSTIDFDKPAEEYPLDKLPASSKWEQKGHYEVVEEGENISLELRDEGEVAMNYAFRGDAATKNINYGGLPVESLLGTTIVVYKDKVSYLKTNIHHTETFELLQKLLNKLGKPTEIIENDTTSLLLEGWEFLNKNIPQYVKKGKTDGGDDTVFYPQYFIWVKGDVIYKLTLSAVNQFVSNNLTIITKQAFIDKIIVGYQNPEDNPILGKYFK